jgi:elongation factor Ts
MQPMNATIEVIKRLRGATGAGVMECRKALEQSSQDFTKALDYLRETAAIKALKQTGREAREGKIELYSHGNGRIGVMVEINIETEFASRSQAFRHLAHEIALQITSTAPLYVRDEDIPPQILDEQAQAAAEKARIAGKPEKVIEQIVAGFLEKYKNKHVLLRQAYIRDEAITVAQLLSQAISQIGENIVIRRFVRWEICPDAEAIAS